MLEIRANDSESNKYLQTHTLFLDGKLIENSSVFIGFRPKHITLLGFRPSIHVMNFDLDVFFSATNVDSLYLKLFSHEINLPYFYKTPNVSHFGLDSKELPKFSIEIERKVRKTPNQRTQFRAYFYFNIDNLDWVEPYTLRDYKEEFKKTVLLIKDSKIIDEYFKIQFRRKRKGLGSFCFISLYPINPTTKIKDVITKIVETVKFFHLETTISLSKKIEKDSVIISINNFPAEFRVACKQYLLYFEEFLRDLGISATSGIKQEAENILFTITPNDKTIPLIKIRKALDIYLELPRSPLIDSKNPDNGIREIKYIHEVNTLKMKLSQAEMQIHYEKQLNTEKERVIQALSLFTKSVIEDSVKPSLSEKAPDEKRKLLKGTVEVGKLKVRDGIEIDIPKLLENTKLDAIFDQLEEYLNTPLITELKLNEPSED
ncbi:MAG: hypothetical protein K1X72_27910 [Pyrinomonadaceae bacterium]|nr:hypothetical protein [Pyrinomonadaceae bacterium]